MPQSVNCAPVDVAVALSARRQSGEIASGAGLAEQLAPDVVGVQDPRQPPRPLLVGAVHHQCRAEHRQAHSTEEVGRVGPGHLLVVDRDLRGRRASTAVLGRPVDAYPAVRVQRALPLP
jgi:hypothetical protein